MKARLYQPQKPATQSGVASTRHWVLEFLPSSPRRPDALMGWTSSGDTNAQVRMVFPNREAAQRYATKVGLDIDIENLVRSHKRPNNYTMNFRPDLVRS